MILILAALTLSGCSYGNPKWVLIEYPTEGENTIMKFPGVRADDLQECRRQLYVIKKTRDESYRGKFQCGSNCRFSKEWGGPLCDELVDL